MYIDGLSFPVDLYFQILCIAAHKRVKKMNFVNTRTTICHIHGFHTRTRHKKNQLLLMYFTSWNDLFLKTSSCKAKVKKNNYVQLHEDLQQVQLGGDVWWPKCRIFILFSLHYSSHSSLFITPLTIPYTIFINKGLPCYFPIYLFLSISREFVIKY